LSHARRRIRTLAIAGCLTASAGTIAAGPVASACASNASLKKVLETDLPKILAEEAKFTGALSEYEKTGDVSTIDAALNSNIEIVLTTRSEIAAQKVLGKSFGIAKAKLEKALARIIRAYRRLKVAFSVKHADPRAAKREAKRAVSAITRADRELLEATVLLGR